MNRSLVLFLSLLFILVFVSQSNLVLGGRASPKSNQNNKYTNRQVSRGADQDDDELIEYQTVPSTLYEKIYHNLLSFYNHHSFDDLSNEHNYINNNKDNNNNNDIRVNTVENNSKFNVHKIFNQFNQFIHLLYNNNDESQQQQQDDKPKLTLAHTIDIKNKKKIQQNILNAVNNINSIDHQYQSYLDTASKYSKSYQLNNNNNNNNNNNKEQQVKTKENSLQYTPSQFCSNIGVLTYDNQLTNTCQPSQSIPCRPVTMVCNNQTINVDITTPVDNSIDYNQCQLLEMKCLSNQPNDNINFQNQYKLNYCSMSMTCTTGQLWQCEIQNVICDTSTSFNSQVFGFKCINEQLVCNGVVIPKSLYTTTIVQYQITSGQCKVQTIPCNPTDECLSLDIDCKSQGTDCSLQIDQDTVCADYCVRSVNTSACACPADYNSPTCGSQTPFTCNLQTIQPTPNCTGDMVLTTQKCFEYSLSDTASFGYLMNCHFTQSVDSSNPNNFPYWINLPNFKLSNPVQWQLKTDIINFYQLYTDFDNTSTTPITKEQMMGQSMLWVNTTLSSIPANRWISKRSYFEIGLVTGNANLTISRFYINAIDYPDNAIVSHVSTWKKTLIIVICTLVGVASIRKIHSDSFNLKSQSTHPSIIHSYTLHHIHSIPSSVTTNTLYSYFYLYI
ncbi:hypothetical protein DFA_03329 [Cavenderia fasciculata]|uniref:Transmembrane protein n=1 Tax=Cavenderia fasciculata TaxID=261658 RepID=F4PH99_CACFS|nr:uncharacterized protein DFA_03329 [Cavenderia fasciculata]EGG25083.1 hypothetical protein DFA_03329 [Cavenderia fasciculata]|eukprot:XP_004362934.1 hypothetical protein DFA_03329 [Cavenderia fasciculata]